MEPLPDVEEMTEAPALALTTAEVVDRYESLVYGIAVSHTRCRADADDVYQDVFLTYHRRQPTCRSEEHRKAWLITTALTIARSLASSSWRRRVVPLYPEPDAEAVDRFQFATVQQNDVFTALRSLPLTYRTPLYLFYFADQPVAQIAEVLQTTGAAVKMRLSRGRTLMRDLLKEGPFDE